MKHLNIYPAFSLLLLASALSAERAYAQFDQSISVDGKYTPEIIRLDRINTFPRQERFELESRPLSYDGTGVTAAFAPSLLTMPATGWRDTRKISARKGYVELGAGSWLNSTLSAGYRFLQSDDAVLGVRLQHNSTSLWQPKVTPLLDTHMQRYDESVAIFGSRLFKGIGRLDASVDYHFGHFNYYGYIPGEGTCGISTEDAKAPSQTLNDISAKIAWTSDSPSGDFSWNASAGVRYFGYRRFYFPELDPDVNCIRTFLSGVKATRETDINIAGGFNLPTSSTSSLGIDLDADVLLYSGYKEEKNLHPLFTTSLLRPDNYGMVTLTPYYRFSIDKLNLRVGARVDIAANAGEEGDRYNAFHISPAVTLDYNAGPAQLYLHLLGGSRLNTLASGAELDYYRQPFLLSTRPVYSPLDGSFGAGFGPFSGFSAGVEFAFRVARGEYLGGWYQQLLNNDLIHPAALLPTETDGHALTYSYLDAPGINMHGFSIGANAAYDFGKAFKIKGRFNYQPQNGRKGFFNGFDRPRITASVGAESNPWNTLRLMLQYSYRGVRNIYTFGEYTADNGMPATLLTPRRLPDITSLDFGASYAFSESFSVWAQACNLLDRHDETLPGLPSQGLTLSAGISFLFD